MRGEFRKELVDSLLKLREYIWNNFKVDEQIFMEALEQSANARGYLIGAISELALSYSLATYGYHIHRIPEKWKGEKRHFADFYVSEDGAVWYLLEVKGLKSNAEEWTKLYNLNKLVRFLSDKALRKPIAKLLGLDGEQKDAELKQKLTSWIIDNFPKFDSEYREEIPDERAKREDRAKVEERLHYLREGGFAPLLTHLVSKAGTGKRSQATPRKDEFDILAVNLFLRVGEHKFVYANTKELPTSKNSKDHLQQNYKIGLYFKGEIYLNDPWEEDFKSIFNSVKKKGGRSIPKDDLNIDTRWLPNLGGKP